MNQMGPMKPWIQKIPLAPRISAAGLLETGNPRLRRISASTKCVLYFQDGCRNVVIYARRKWKAQSAEIRIRIAGKYERHSLLGPDLVCIGSLNVGTRGNK